VPELASRAHQINIVPVVQQALEEAGVLLQELSGIGFTQGPGLLGSLLVGSSFAKGMALSLDLPLLPVHHMKAHILAHFIENPAPHFPFICLTVSGGHTQIVKVTSYTEMEILGETIDDAVGEAFDKAAKMLGLPYPGGPEIDTLAQKGNPNAFTFSKTSVPGLDYSVSGIKTSILYFLKAQMKEDPSFIKNNLEDIAASIQQSLISMLMEKVKLAIKQEGITQIAIAGGVSANSLLRKEVERLGAGSNMDVFVPKFEYCTDNAAMIALSAYFQYKAGADVVDLEVQSMPRMTF
jgi:N6-L-threonylcarbamoyladenine synthase